MVRVLGLHEIFRVLGFKGWKTHENLEES